MNGFLSANLTIARLPGGRVIEAYYLIYEEDGTSELL